MHIFFPMCLMADLSFKVLVIDGFCPKGHFCLQGAHMSALGCDIQPNFETHHFLISTLPGWRERGGNIFTNKWQKTRYVCAPPFFFSVLRSFSCQTQLSFSWSQFLQTNSLPDHQLRVVGEELVKGGGQTAVASCAR